MIRATVILYLLAFLCVVVGLWDHSWQLILAGTTLLVVWPIIQEEVTPHETHHDPDDGGNRRSTPGVRVPTDSRVLDVSRAGCGTHTDAELMDEVERWYTERFGDDASS